MRKLNSKKPAALLLLLGCLLFVSMAGNGQTLYSTSYFTDGDETGAIYYTGSIVKYDVPSKKMTKVHDFFEEGSVPTGPTLCSNGKIYGMTLIGGKYDKGTLYSFDTTTAEFTPLQYFREYNAGGDRRLIQAADGKLYGVGGGNLFSLDPATDEYTIVKNGVSSYNAESGQIVQALNGKIYGTIPYGGSKYAGFIYSVDLATHEYTDVFDFDNLNGWSPDNLVLAANGKLYGTTYRGGSGNDGVIFSFDPATNIFAKVKEFNGHNGSHPNSLKQAANGKLYGSTSVGGINNRGVIFSFDPALVKYTVLKSVSSDEGSYPREILPASNGNIYGVVGSGVVFSFDPVTNEFRKIEFEELASGLSEVDGRIYGAAREPDRIFSFNLASETFTTLVLIGHNNGVEPEGSLVQAPDGKLYGTTLGGGDWDGGIVYSFDPVSSVFAKLKSFKNIDGYQPQAKLLPAKNGKLYGTTYSGGAMNNGVLFSIDPITKEFKKLFDFNASTGQAPGDLIQATNGIIYGVCAFGGNANKGVIFSYNIKTAVYTILYHFNTATGSNPSSGMLLAKNGLLYGTTYRGGPEDQGIFYSFNPATAVYTPLLAGIAGKAHNPYGGLIQAADGKIYGTASGKRYHYNSLTHNVLFSFDPSDYSIYISKEIGWDIHNLLQASDGLIYGSNQQGYHTYSSYVFSFSPKTHIFRTSKDYTDYSNNNSFYPFKSFIEYVPAKPAAFNPAFATERKMPLPNTSFTVKVFPNPSLAAFRLAIQSPLAKEVEISVTDIAGRTLYQTKGSSSATYSFGNTFPKGVYFVRVTQGAATETLRLEKGGR